MAKESSTIDGKEERQRFIDLNNGECCYCGCEVTLTNCAIDHFRPFCVDRRNLKQNFVLSCKTCNEAKGTADYGTVEEVRQHISRVRGVDVSEMWWKFREAKNVAEVLLSGLSDKLLADEEEARKKRERDLQVLQGFFG